MPHVQGNIAFLRRRPEYKTEQPYIIALPPDSEIDPESSKLTNLEYERHLVEVRDIRNNINDFKLEVCGFEVFPYSTSKPLVTTVDDIHLYQRETESALKEKFSAERVISFEFKHRKNAEYNTPVINLEDPLQFLKPAKDAHCDYTFTSGPITAKRVLEEHGEQKYLKPGYRFRIHLEERLAKDHRYAFGSL
ncbi:hypothetical protein PG991_000977 [Apiospora marii]|uniref:Uncharacterized protein n=1 Tax=Apiospora marii TaxID=335849 RepID=A0ABR1STJ2_9PEZI